MDELDVIPIKVSEMRRASFTGVTSGGGPGEPLIVVEESEGIVEEDEEDDSKASSSCESPSVNQYLLTPWRDMRKRSLPTPPCTSGITASQVRRLSERGGEGSGPSPIEQAFLATLSQAPAPQPGARRHSVVTISRAPPPSVVFGRNRRESIAAFASGLPGLPLRRDSNASQHRGSISGDSTRGSTFNLQLDIMDDITEAKQRAKEKRKVTRTPSRERMNEPETCESGLCPGSSKERRYSEFNVGAAKLPVQSSSQKRRASELPSLNFTALSCSTSSSSKKQGEGVVCTNTDLVSILSPLTSSAQEISADTEKEKETPNVASNPNVGSPTRQVNLLDKKRKQLHDRSNSFDIGSLPGSSSASNWFVKRHQPIAKKEELTQPKSNIMVTFTDEKEKPKTSLVGEKKCDAKKTMAASASPTTETNKKNKVVWDNRSGSLVDAQVLGSAIEVFLNRRSSQEPCSPGSKPSQTSPKDSPSKPSKTWFSNPKEASEEAGSSETCDSSICSALKDLFVK